MTDIRSAAVVLRMQSCLNYRICHNLSVGRIYNLELEGLQERGDPIWVFGKGWSSGSLLRPWHLGFGLLQEAVS